MTPHWLTEVDRLLEELERAGLVATFWHYTNRMELLLGREVLTLALGGTVSADALESVMTHLDEALVRGPAPVEAETLADHFTQILGVLEKAAPGVAPPAAMADLRATLVAAQQRVADHRQASQASR